MDNPAGGKEKIAILGGGIGALATAYALTKQPGWRERYDITVYQMGWRLGGKGACGRNAELGERIEEHGPHVWFGFYNQAFEMLRDCYCYVREHGLAPDTPMSNCIPDAMGPLDHSSLMENVNGEWKAWHVDFPPRPGTPGDVSPDAWEQVLYAIDWLLDHERNIRRHTEGSLEKTELHTNHLAALLLWLYHVTCRLLGIESGARPKDKKESLLTHARSLAGGPHLRHRREHPVHQRYLAWLGDKVIAFVLGRFIRQLKKAVEHLLAEQDEIRRAWRILDLGIANLRGLFSEHVLSRGFDSINGEDYSVWIERHGCFEPWSPLVQGIYDTCFGFIDGRTDSLGPNVRPASASMEAGTMVRGMLLMFFGYCGSYAYKMQSGMGDTIFAPVYLALRDQGIKFEFFHRVNELVVRDGAIDTISVDVQATVKPEVLRQYGGYQPLRTVKGMPCWPNHPRFEQLEQGDELQQEGVDLESSWSGWQGKPGTLRRGEHFDTVVLGISLGALPSICKQLIAADERWARMVREVRTVATQAFQVWIRKTSEEMGWQVDPAGRQFDLMSGYVQPYDSWADMSQVLDKEDWRALDPRSVHYIFGPLAECEPQPQPGTRSDYPEKKLAEAKAAALKFLRTSVRPLWPAGVNAFGALDWNLIADPGNRQGEERFDSQYWRANVDGSERYVLSVAGSCRHRLRPDNSGFSNLYLAGDWTRNGLDVGCVESGALSGVIAAGAIASRTRQESSLAKKRSAAAGSNP
jgi:uncharacterized protein with NAD-binding domain and iron-sulfur cluster